ncbi:hypothetical protein V5799_020263 [Amblyomma americanum]|uniref:Uncharacterized protein n=1 Tax=Amblyomma americanum TaxID=6943 RepID=A0AAQ4EUA4_AMBAM
MAEDRDENERPAPSKALTEEKGAKEASDEEHANRDGSDSDETAEQGPEPPYYSPGCPSTTQEEEAAAAAAAAAEPEEEGGTWANRAFLAWVLCGVGAAIIVIPLAFILLPLLFPPDEGRAADRAGGRPPLGEDEGGRPDDPIVRPSCAQTSPKISQDVSGVRDVDYPGKANTSQSSLKLYCLYNNSRYRNSDGKDFLPRHVPFALCTSLIYWSMAITNGVITSRAEKFDEKHGLYKLREISQIQLANVTGSKPANILMTLGGYPEDSGHFHLLAGNHTIRHRLVREVYVKSLNYKLNGTNVHWVTSNILDCERGLQQQRWRTLSLFLDDVLALLSLNYFPGEFLITVMIDPQDISNTEAIKVLINKANVTFLNTHLITPLQNTLKAYCETANTIAGLVMRITNNQPAENKVCASATLSLPAWTSVSEAAPVPAQPISKTEGRLAMYEVCKNTECTDANLGYQDCYVCKTKFGADDVYCAADNKDSAQKKYHAVDKLCMVLFDMDFDNFFQQCGPNSPPDLFLRMKSYVHALIDAGSLNPSDFFPPYVLSPIL